MVTSVFWGKNNHTDSADNGDFGLGIYAVAIGWRAGRDHSKFKFVCHDLCGRTTDATPKDLVIAQIIHQHLG